jgi:hypothetical protein
VGKTNQKNIKKKLKRKRQFEIKSSIQIYMLVKHQIRTAVGPNKRSQYSNI